MDEPFPGWLDSVLGAAGFEVAVLPVCIAPDALAGWVAVVARKR